MNLQQAKIDNLSKRGCIFCKILRTIWKTNKQTNFIEYINAILWRRHRDMSELSAIFDKHKWVAWSGDWSTQNSEFRIYNQGIPLLHIIFCILTHIHS